MCYSEWRCNVDQCQNVFITCYQACTGNEIVINGQCGQTKMQELTHPCMQFLLSWTPTRTGIDHRRLGSATAGPTVGDWCQRQQVYQWHTPACSYRCGNFNHHNGNRSHNKQYTQTTQRIQAPAGACELDTLVARHSCRKQRAIYRSMITLSALAIVVAAAMYTALQDILPSTIATCSTRIWKAPPRTLSKARKYTRHKGKIKIQARIPINRITKMRGSPNIASYNDNKYRMRSTLIPRMVDKQVVAITLLYLLVSPHLTAHTSNTVLQQWHDLRTQSSTETGYTGDEYESTFNYAAHPPQAVTTQQCNYKWPYAQPHRWEVTNPRPILISQGVESQPGPAAPAAATAAIEPSNSQVRVIRINEECTNNDKCPTIEDRITVVTRNIRGILSNLASLVRNRDHIIAVQEADTNEYNVADLVAQAEMAGYQIVFGTECALGTDAAGPAGRRVAILVGGNTKSVDITREEDTNTNFLKQSGRLVERLIPLQHGRQIVVALLYGYAGASSNACVLADNEKLVAAAL